MSIEKPYEYQISDILLDHVDAVFDPLENNQVELHDRAVALKNRSLVQDGVAPTIHFDFANQRYSKWTPSGMLNSSDLTDVAYFVRSNIAGGTSADGRIIDVASGEPVYDYRGGICRGLYSGSDKMSLCGTPTATLQTSQSETTTEIVANQIYNTTAVDTTGAAGYIERNMSDYSDGDYLFVARLSNKTGASDIVRFQPVHYDNVGNGTTPRTTIDINFNLNNLTWSVNYSDFVKDADIFEEGDSGIFTCWAVITFSGVTQARHRLRHDNLDDSSFNIHGFDAYRVGTDLQLIQGAVAGTTYTGDLCYMDFDGEYNSKEGTLVTEFYAPDYLTDRHFFSTLRSDTVYTVGLVILSNGTVHLRSYNGGSDVFTLIGTITPGERCRVCLAYDNSGQYVYVSLNGSDIVTLELSLNMTVPTRLYPSSNNSTSTGQWGPLRSAISQTTYYPKRLSLTTIKNLSTVL